MKFQPNENKAATLETTIYVARSGMTGSFMPNSVAYFATKQECINFMREERKTAIDQGYNVKGNPIDGYVIGFGMDFTSREHFEMESVTLKHCGLTANDIDGKNVREVLDDLNQI